MALCRRWHSAGSRAPSSDLTGQALLAQRLPFVPLAGWLSGVMDARGSLVLLLLASLGCPPRVCSPQADEAPGNGSAADLTGSCFRGGGLGGGPASHCHRLSPQAAKTQKRPDTSPRCRRTSPSFRTKRKRCSPLPKVRLPCAPLGLCGAPDRCLWGASLRHPSLPACSCPGPCFPPGGPTPASHGGTPVLPDHREVLTSITARSRQSESVQHSSLPLVFLVSLSPPLNGD